MIKNKLIGKIGCLLMLVWASVSLHAQSIELLGLYSNGSAGQLKAKVELAGKQIKSVTSYAYRMSDGFATTASETMPIAWKWCWTTTPGCLPSA